MTDHALSVAYMRRDGCDRIVGVILLVVVGDGVRCMEISIIVSRARDAWLLGTCTAHGCGVEEDGVGDWKKLCEAVCQKERQIGWHLGEEGE